MQDQTTLNCEYAVKRVELATQGNKNLVIRQVLRDLRAKSKFKLGLQLGKRVREIALNNL